MQYILDDINYPSNLTATEYIYTRPTASVALFVSELNVKEVTLVEDLHTRTLGNKVMQKTKAELQLKKDEHRDDTFKNQRSILQRC